MSRFKDPFRTLPTSSKLPACGFLYEDPQVREHSSVELCGPHVAIYTPRVMLRSSNGGFLYEDSQPLDAPPESSPTGSNASSNVSPSAALLALMSARAAAHDRHTELRDELKQLDAKRTFLRDDISMLVSPRFP